MTTTMDVLVDVKQGIAELIKQETDERMQIGMMKIIDMINVKLRLLEEKSLD